EWDLDRLARRFERVVDVVADEAGRDQDQLTAAVTDRVPRRFQLARLGAVNPPDANTDEEVELALDLRAASVGHEVGTVSLEPGPKPGELGARDGHDRTCPRGASLGVQRARSTSRSPASARSSAMLVGCRPSVASRASDKRAIQTQSRSSKLFEA